MIQPLTGPEGFPEPSPPQEIFPLQGYLTETTLCRTAFYETLGESFVNPIHYRTEVAIIKSFLDAEGYGISSYGRVMAYMLAANDFPQPFHPSHYPKLSKDGLVELVAGTFLEEDKKRIFTSLTLANIMGLTHFKTVHGSSSAGNGALSPLERGLNLEEDNVYRGRVANVFCWMCQDLFFDRGGLYIPRGEDFPGLYRGQPTAGTIIKDLHTEEILVQVYVNKYLEFVAQCHTPAHYNNRF
jgi:hypothetical protein